MRYLFLCLWLTTFPAMADELDFLLATVPSQRADTQTRLLQRHLNLQGEQLEGIHQINLRYAEKAEPIIKGNQLRLLKLYSLRNIQQEKDQELQSLLSAEQFEHYREEKERLFEAFKRELIAQRPHQ